MFRSLLLFVALLGVRLDVTSATVKVDVYVEALCPYCRDFVVENLKTYYDTGLWQAMDIHMYYAGNAELEGTAEDKDFTLTCQHGDRECFLNKVIGCGISRFAKSEDWFPFVYCMEKGVRNAHDGTLTTKRSLRWFDALYDASCDSNWSFGYCYRIKSCCAKVGLKKADIMACAKGREGEEIQLAAYSAFAHLEVHARGVPWIIVNGKPKEHLPYSLTYYLCEDFDAYSRPPICQNVRGVNGAGLDVEHNMCLPYEDAA